MTQVIPLLKHPNELISREVLTFLKALLYGGNGEVQKGLDNFKTTREESLFVTLRNIVMHAAVGYQERFAKFNDPQIYLYINSRD